MQKGVQLVAWAVLLLLSVPVGAQTPADDKARLEAAQRRLEERNKARLEAEAKAKADAAAKGATQPAAAAGAAPGTALRPTLPADPDAATTAYAATAKAADERYATAVDAARRELLGVLEVQKVAVLKSGDLDEANAIQSAIRSDDKDIGDYLRLVRSDTANKAIAGYLKAKDAAATQRDDSVSAAAAELLKVLESAKAGAMKAGDLDKANAIQQSIVKVRGKAPLFDLGGSQRIVFVCDSTGTMINKFATLKHELTKAVANLRPTQSYNVVFFTAGGKYHIADKNGLIPATPDNKRNTYSFFEEMTPTGTTDPIPGIEAGFKQMPEVLYFLTDGEFNNLKSYNEVIATFRKANAGRKVRVNTILFETYDKQAEAVMQKIATENGGNYRYVREADLLPR